MPCVGAKYYTSGQSYPNALKVRITDQAYTSQQEMYFTTRHSPHNCRAAIIFVLGMHYVHYIINCQPTYVVCYIIFYDTPPDQPLCVALHISSTNTGFSAGDVIFLMILHQLLPIVFTSIHFSIGEVIFFYDTPPDQPPDCLCKHDKKFKMICWNMGLSTTHCLCKNDKYFNDLSE